MKRTIGFSAAALLCAAVAATPAQAGFCVNARIDKGTWFTARVSADNGKFVHETLYAGQSVCTPDDAKTVSIEVNVLGAAWLVMGTKGSCTVDIWGTTHMMYFSESGQCEYGTSVFTKRGQL